jgi:hypothetical protein
MSVKVFLFIFMAKADFIAFAWLGPVSRDIHGCFGIINWDYVRQMRIFQKEFYRLTGRK